MEAIKADLYDFFSAVQTDNRCLYIDTFTVICWMHKRGEKTAALKLLPDLFKAVGSELNRSHQTLAKNVSRLIDGNEDQLISSVPTRSEFRALAD